MMEYVIIAMEGERLSFVLDYMKNEINERLKDGWELRGDLQISCSMATPDAVLKDKLFFMTQAMVRDNIFGATAAEEE